MTGNAVYSNDHGIEADNSYAPYLSNNLVYANTTYGIGVHGSQAQLVNNTVYQPAGDAAIVDGGSVNVRLENNILWAVMGHDLAVTPDSENGFASDYNDLVALNGNLLGQWEGRNFSNRVDWFYELGFDQHSITADPQFITPAGADGILGYGAAGDGGSDDNFHVPNTSPTVDSGDPQSAYNNEPAPNGGRVNLGYDGNTPGAAASLIQFVQELSPAGQEKFQAGQTVPVLWRDVGLFGPAGYYSNEVLSDGPMAFYPLGDAPDATTAADATGHGLGGSYQGGVTLGLQGALPADPNMAVQLPGGDYNSTAGYLQLPSGFADFHNGLTFEVWAFPTSVASNEHFLELGNGYSNDNIVLARDGTTNNLVFQVFSSGRAGAIVRAPGAIQLNKWQHFAVTEDAAGNVTLYKNGIAIASGATAVPQNITRSTNYLGKSSFFDPFYAGLLDDAAIYNQPLSAGRILDHYNHAYFGTVNIDLLRDGDPTFDQRLADHAVDNGEFAWTIPANQLLAGDYRIRIQANDGILPQATTPVPFLIAGAGHDYYINDGSTAGDVFTTAIGNDANSGKSPDQPVASLAALLTAYDFGPGDVIHADSGAYNLIRNVRLFAQDSGVTIVGPSTATALFNRGNINSGANVFEFDGAKDVTLDHLSVTGGFNGIQVYDTGSQRVTIADSEVFGNAVDGIQFFGYSVTDGRVTNNRVHDNGGYSGIAVGAGAGMVATGNTVYHNYGDGITASPGANIPGYLIADNTVYGNNEGITASGSGTAVQDNTVYSNKASGIQLGYGAVAVHNTVYGQIVSGAVAQGIYLFGGEARNNTVFDNYNGIAGYGTFDGNRAYHNSHAGIVASAASTVTGNAVYSNDHGIEADSLYAGPYLNNNLVYANAKYGIGVHGAAAQVVNNTVYQSTGDAITVDGGSLNVQIENNILWASAGRDLVASADESELNLRSDYNDLYTTGAGVLGRWDGADFATRAAWFYQVGLDQHSIAADPQFVNAAGADGLLGFNAGATGPAQIIDDSSPAFTVTGAWTTQPNGYGGSEHVSNGRNNDAAAWTIANLTPGSWCQLAVTWPSGGAASGAPFTVADGNQALASLSLDQTSSPSDFTDAGVGWKTLGTFYVTSGTLTVSVTHASSYYPNVLADAVRVQAVVGDHGADDDFHLKSSSTSIDAGDPTTPFENEPSPNGGRVNLGNYGNTPDATSTPLPAVEVLSPTGFDKFQVGQTVSISWRTVGAYAPNGYYANDIQTDQPLAYYRLGETSGATARDGSGHGLDGSYVNQPTLGANGALMQDADTGVQFPGGNWSSTAGYVQLPSGFADFHNGLSFEVWAYPTAIGNGQALFDLGGGYANNNIMLAREGTTNNLIFQVYAGGVPGSVVRAADAIELDKWQHFAVTEDGAGT